MMQLQAFLGSDSPNTGTADHTLYILFYYILGNIKKIIGTYFIQSLILPFPLENMDRRAI